MTGLFFGGGGGPSDGNCDRFDGHANMAPADLVRTGAAGAASQIAFRRRPGSDGHSIGSLPMPGPLPMAWNFRDKPGRNASRSE